MIPRSAWVATSDARHASTDPSPECGYPTGVSVQTLCGHPVIADNDRGRSRRTCLVCAERALVRVVEGGVRRDRA